MSSIFEKNDSILEAAREQLSSTMPKFVDVFETLSEDEMPKLLFVYRTMITLLYTSEDVNGLVKRLSAESSLIKDGTLSQLFAFILHLSAERGDVIDVAFVNRLLKAETMSPRVSSALVTYISKTAPEFLAGISTPKSASAEQMAVICALIPKLEAIRDSALSRLDKELRAGGAAQMLSERVSALLEVFSVAVEDSSKFEWAPSASEEVQAKLQNVFNVAQKELLQSAPDAAQVSVLRRAASLFPSLDRERVLKHVASDRKRSALTENTVALIDALVVDSDDLAIPEMKGWFLMAFDYLTRRFAEEGALSPKVTAFAKALGMAIIHGVFVMLLTPFRQDHFQTANQH